jgi:hypothetical protein
MIRAKLGRHPGKAWMMLSMSWLCHDVGEAHTIVIRAKPTRHPGEARMIHDLMYMSRDIDYCNLVYSFIWFFFCKREINNNNNEV